MNVLYTATALAAGDGRNGHARSDDAILENRDPSYPNSLSRRCGGDGVGSDRNSSSSRLCSCTAQLYSVAGRLHGVDLA